MGHLLGIRIQRYRTLRNVALGRDAYDSDKDDLPPLTCLIGPNGSGKSTLLDAFGFLADCLREDIEAACEKSHRGGFQNLRTQGETGPIEFELHFREDNRSRPITYSLAIDEREGRPVVASELLWQHREGPQHRRPEPFVSLKHGKGRAWTGQSMKTQEGNSSVDVRLSDKRRLGLATLGQLKEHPRIVQLRSFMEAWYLSYFLPDAARTFPTAGAQRHLSRTGDNLANVVQYMERGHPARFKSVLQKLAQRIPGVKQITYSHSADGRLLLAFDEQGYKDPFHAPDMSDGTLKMFAYLLLLEDPDAFPFIGIEEPENGLYHKLVERLAFEMKEHGAGQGSNLLVTTHSPYFIDALKPEQVWFMQRNDQGHSEVTRVADFPHIQEMVNEGIPLGSLWHGNHFQEKVSL